MIWRSVLKVGPLAGRAPDLVWEWFVSKNQNQPLTYKLSLCWHSGSSYNTWPNLLTTSPLSLKKYWFSCGILFCLWTLQMLVLKTQLLNTTTAPSAFVCVHYHWIAAVESPFLWTRFWTVEKHKKSSCQCGHWRLVPGFCGTRQILFSGRSLCLKCW